MPTKDGRVTEEVTQEDVFKPFNDYLDNCSIEIQDLDLRCREYAAASGESKDAFMLYPEIHGEIRMAFTHISRAAIGLDVTEAEKSDGEDPAGRDLEELEKKLSTVFSGDWKQVDQFFRDHSGAPFSGEKAKGELAGSLKHLERAARDCKKAQFEVTEKSSRLWFDRYIVHGIQGVGEGKFISDFEDDIKRGRSSYQAAKLAEALGYENAPRRLYVKALEPLNRARDLLERCRPDLEESKERSERRQINSLRVWLAMIAVEILIVVVGYVLKSLNG